MLAVDECPTNLGVHQVVGCLRIISAGVKEEMLAIHGRVGLR